MSTSTGNFFSNFLLFKNEAKPAKVTGTPDYIAQYVYKDILIIKNEIKQYNELTGLLSSNSFYYKIYKLLENNHQEEIQNLKKNHNFDTTTQNINYHRQLISIYKKHLNDLQNLLDTLNYNYNHGVHEKKIVEYRQNDNQRNNSVTSFKSSNSSRLSLSNSVRSSFSNPSSTLDDSDAPDHLLDPISFQLFNEPVVTPSGITYEKSNLLNHISQKGKYDPLTRTPLKENQLYPNLIAKDAVNQYLQQKLNKEPIS